MTGYGSANQKFMESILLRYLIFFSSTDYKLWVIGLHSEMSGVLFMYIWKTISEFQHLFFHVFLLVTFYPNASSTLKQLLLSIIG